MFEFMDTESVYSTQQTQANFHPSILWKQERKGGRKRSIGDRVLYYFA